MAIDLTGKKAIVTGGANGIGLAIAREFAAGGAAVWVFDLAREKPAEVASAFGGAGIAVDVTNRQSIEAGFDAVGEVDIVAVNAGTAISAPLEETTRAIWDKTVALNLTGAFETVQAAVARMKNRRRGAIVLTASTNSYDGEADLTAYNATKAGLLGILHTVANEAGPFGIRINAVNPGFIRTRLTAAAFADPGVMKAYFRAIPMGRGGEPHEVARAVAFLASDYASFITGATLLVDGGQMACKFAAWTDENAIFSEDHWTLKSCR